MKKIRNDVLSRHIKTIHEGKKYEYKTSNKAFSRPSSLKSHQSVVHKGKKYECKTCSRQTHQKDSCREKCVI